MAAVLALPDAVEPVDVLVNNVGVMLARPRRTAEGIDAGFATNLLGHYLLTETLAEQRKLVPDATVISMSSGGAYNVPLEIEALTDLVPYDGTLAYAYHKRAQLVLNAHWRSARQEALRAYVMHPGWVDTPGVAGSMPLFRMALGPILRHPAAGADTALWLAATRPEQRSPESLWFDRAENPSHLLPGTRQGASRAALLDLLEAHRRELLGAGG
jgi:NAD(P)-dependent dehydrogenase (short-subunit alcohol dehydrogenase family)